MHRVMFRMGRADITMDVTKSRYDLREYKVIDLANGITALLISDLKDKAADDDVDGDAASSSSSDTDTPSDCNQSAAALCVGVGSFSDPDDVQGLAHFLEHMVFMGSRKYPEENGFDAFVSKHGGYSNACTDCERTIFKFSIPPKYFREGLDMFCHFFVSPLLGQSSVEREIEAVDSEFHLASQSDSCRLQQLRNHIAVNGHPMSKFLWGNSVSLKKNPAEQGINIHERVKEFYGQYYSSSYMTLAVISQDTLDDLEQWVTESFASVPNNNQPSPVFSNYPKPYDDSFHRLYKVIPIKDTHQLHIMWCLPPCHDQYKIKPLQYLGWLVGHEGAGSIMSLLKKKHYAVSLEAGNGCQGYEMNTNFSLFQCSITLTDKGYDNIIECCSIVFQYIKMLQQIGPVERVFKEMQSVEDISFTFREAEEPIEYVEWISESMQLYPRQQYLIGKFLMFDYQPEVIQNIQNMLVPEAANIVFMSPRVGGECSLQEPWFKTTYSVEDVPSEWLEQWKSLPLHPQLHIPSVNPFIATEFKLKDVDQNTSEYPQAIKDIPHYKLWYRQDDVFKLFRARIYVHFISPYPSHSAERAVMSDLMVELLLHNVAEVGYQAEIAHLSYSVVAERSGIVMKLSGFDHKISLLYETLIDHISSFETSEEDFVTVKSELKKNYHNSVIKAKKLSKQMRLKVIEQVFWSTVDKIDVIDCISLANFMDFVQLFKKELYVEALVQGNMTSQEAIGLMEYLCSHINYQPLSSDLQPKFRTMELPCNKVLLWQQSGLNQQSPNTAIVNYYQCCHSDLYSHTLTQLLIQCMNEPCFDVLRTKNQLGYDVHCTTHLTNGIVGFSLAVVTQATKFSVDEASQCMIQFVYDFYDFLAGLTDEDFEDHVKALIDVILEVDTSLEQEVSRNWSEVMKHFYVFDRRHKELNTFIRAFPSLHVGISDHSYQFEQILCSNDQDYQLKKKGQVAILQNITQQDLIDWFKKHTRVGADLRLLRVQITGHGDKQIDQSDDSIDYDDEVVYINDINKFKQSISVLPVTMVTS